MDAPVESFCSKCGRYAVVKPEILKGAKRGKNHKCVGCSARDSLVTAQMWDEMRAKGVRA